MVTRHSRVVSTARTHRQRQAGRRPAGPASIPDDPAGSCQDPLVGPAVGRLSGAWSCRAQPPVRRDRTSLEGQRRPGPRRNVPSGRPRRATSLRESCLSLVMLRCNSGPTPNRRRPTPDEIVEGGRLGRPCGPGAHSRAIWKTQYAVRRHSTFQREESHSTELAMSFTASLRFQFLLGSGVICQPRGLGMVPIRPDGLRGLSPSLDAWPAGEGTVKRRSLQLVRTADDRLRRR
jgi:hypothetical protein